METHTAEEFEVAFAKFLARANELVRARYTAQAPSLTPPAVVRDPRGQRYVRVVVGPEGSRYVYCFVEVATGDVLKADGWKRPANGVRGTIYGPPEGYGITGYGAEYRR